jgi:DNA repair protein RadA/Sms
MMMGVLERRAGVRLATADCFVATVGGVRLSEPATDMAVALAIASSAADAPLPPGLVAFGEIGLAGDVRPIGSLDRRLAEAGRLGFTDVIAPARALRARGGAASLPAGMRMHEVSSVQEAIRTAQNLSRAVARTSTEGAS